MSHSGEPTIDWQSDADRWRSCVDLLDSAERLAEWPALPGEPAPTYCLRIGTEYQILQPGVGAICFRPDRFSILAVQAPDGSEPWFRQVVMRSWLPAIYQVWGRQVVHASAAASPSTGAVVIFTGPSGAGKSTLAYGLGQRPGWRQVADDSVAFSSSNGVVTLHPLANDVRLRPGAAAHYKWTRREGPLPWPSATVPAPTAIYAISALDGAPAPVAIVPLGAANCYRLLLEQAHAFTLAIPEQNRTLMRDYLALAARPAFRFTYHRSFASMDAILDALERHQASLATGDACALPRSR